MTTTDEQGFTRSELRLIAGLAMLDVRTVARHLIEQRPTVQPRTAREIARAVEQFNRMRAQGEA